MDSTPGLMDRTPKYGSFSVVLHESQERTPNTSTQEAERPWPGKGTPASVGQCRSSSRFPFFVDSFYFLAAPGLSCGMGDLSSPTGNRIQAPCTGSTESQPLDPQGSPKWEPLDTLLFTSDNHADKELGRPQSVHNTTGCREGSLSLEDTEGSYTRRGHSGTVPTC